MTDDPMADNSIERIKDVFDTNDFAISSSQKLVHRAIVRCGTGHGSFRVVVIVVNEMGETTFTTSDVTENTSLSTTTVRRKLKILEENGLLVADRSSKATMWHLSTFFDAPNGDVSVVEVRNV